MTEDEMKQTWCPHLRVAGVEGIPASNAVMDPDSVAPVLLRSGFNCLGRGCSQWRWDDVPNPTYATWQRANRNHLLLHYDEAPPSSLKSTTDGHCGRAGRP